MPDINLLKNNIVVTKVFNVDCDTVVISDEAKVGDIYDPETGTFASPAPPPPPEQQPEEPAEKPEQPTEGDENE